MLWLKLLPSKWSTSSLLNKENLSEPAIFRLFNLHICDFIFPQNSTKWIFKNKWIYIYDLFIFKEKVKKKKILSNNLLWSNRLVGGKPKSLHTQELSTLHSFAKQWEFYLKGLPWMGIDPYKSLDPKYSSLREAIPLKDERMLLLKWLLSKWSTSSLLNVENLSKPII